MDLNIFIFSQKLANIGGVTLRDNFVDSKIEALKYKIQNNKHV